MIAENTLTIKNISKQYSRGFFPLSLNRKTGQSIKALDNVSFHLSNGIYGLLGPNGAGKSTLIHIITGNMQADMGRLYWNKDPVQKMEKKYRALLGYMPQQQSLYDQFTGRQFLRYFCALKEIPKTKMNEMINSRAGAVNMLGELDKRLEAYSGGMKQRILLATALIGNPKLIVLDEPTAGLDPKERIRMRNLLAINAKNKIILVATHVVSDVDCIAKEIILLKEGTIAAKDTLTNLITTYAPKQNLEEVYLKVFGNED